MTLVGTRDSPLACRRFGARLAEARSRMPALLLQRLQDHNLQCRGTDPPVAVRQEALAEVGAQYRVLGRTQIDGSADAGQRLPGVVEGAVTAPGALEEEVQPVLVEDVERIRAAGGAELLESHA